MLILVAHGSHDARWRASVEKLTESLQADLGPDRVQLAYMDCTPPTLEEVVRHAIEEGADGIRVLPLFITAEGHVDRDIRPVVEQLRTTYGPAKVRMLPPVGQHRLFQDLIAKIAVDVID